MNSSAKKPIQYLVISLLSAERPNLLSELCKIATQCGCTILDSRISTYGSNLAGSMMFSGTWNALAKLETNLNTFEQKNDVRLVSLRSDVRRFTAEVLPYLIYITAVETPGVITKILHYFTEHHMGVYDLNILSYKAPYSETAMLSITLTIAVANNKILADFRETFMLFCDDQNFDAAIEPQKNFS